MATFLQTKYIVEYQQRPRFRIRNWLSKNRQVSMLRDTMLPKAQRGMQMGRRLRLFLNAFPAS
jgi:ribosomal protein L13